MIYEVEFLRKLTATIFEVPSMISRTRTMHRLHCFSGMEIATLDGIIPVEHIFDGDLIVSRYCGVTRIEATSSDLYSGSAFTLSKNTVNSKLRGQTGILHPRVRLFTESRNSATNEKLRAQEVVLFSLKNSVSPEVVDQIRLFSLYFLQEEIIFAPDIMLMSSPI